jgi:RNA polymerase sigma factor (sigma-70 family)
VSGDVELVRAAQNGNTASLGVLLERHRASLLALALHILGRSPQAQDAVQDAFLVALRDIDMLRTPEAAGSWLRGIVRNVCLMKLRADREVHVGDLDAYLDRQRVEPSAEEAIDRMALREWVWTAVGELPEASRVTAMLRYFGSYSTYEELAAILGVPVGTVKSRLNQARIKLADALLETAGMAHDEARQISDSQHRFFTEAHAEFNRGSYEMLSSAFSRNFKIGYPGWAGGGLDFLIRNIWEENLEAGVKLHPTNILASKNVTVIEGIFENPRDDPFHCPPETSIVCLYRDGAIHGIRQHYAPRPEDEHR